MARQSSSRRSFLGRSAIGLAAALALPRTAWAAQLPYMDRIGLQLYTVRNQMAEDKVRTLQAVANAGYKQVELMAINKEAFEIAAVARDHGLMVHSAFMDWKSIVTPQAPETPSVNQTLEWAERLGLRHIVFGYIGRGERETSDQYKRIADASNAAADGARQAGMRMCYHNHSFEFAALQGSDQTGFDILVESFDPKLMEFELDVFWVAIGGHDPMQWMRKLGHRISQVHLKNLKPGVGTVTDEGKVPIDAFQEVGNGTIDMPAVMRLAKDIGVAQCHVEQDQSPAPLDSIAKSIEFLKRA